MKVQELIRAMVAVYKGMDEAAVSALGPVFRQKLERYEGPELANAWVEIAASFKPTPTKPFPLPADYETALPSARKMPSGPRLDFEARAKRRVELLNEWRYHQRPVIETLHGPFVAFWAESEVRDRAGSLAWKEDAGNIRLSAADLTRIVESTVSRDRVCAFGAIPRDAGLWGEQMATSRRNTAAGVHTVDTFATHAEAEVKSAEPEAPWENIPPPAEIAEDEARST